jgi:hypothetical protein
MFIADYQHDKILYIKDAQNRNTSLKNKNKSPDYEFN